MAADPASGDTQIVSYSSTSTQSAALTRAGGYWVTATSACYVSTGANPTANGAAGANASMYLPANYPTPITVARDGWKIAVIRDSADGKLSIAPGGD